MSQHVKSFTQDQREKTHKKWVISLPHTMRRLPHGRGGQAHKRGNIKKNSAPFEKRTPQEKKEKKNRLRIKRHKKEPLNKKGTETQKRANPSYLPRSLPFSSFPLFLFVCALNKGKAKKFLRFSSFFFFSPTTEKKKGHSSIFPPKNYPWIRDQFKRTALSLSLKEKEKEKADAPNPSSPFFCFSLKEKKNRDRRVLHFVRVLVKTLDQTCSGVRTAAAQCAFKDSMIHWVVQFALRIAFRSVLHRYTSREIHRWKSSRLFVFLAYAKSIPRKRYIWFWSLVLGFLQWFEEVVLF